MKFLISIISLVSIVFAEPSWLSKNEKIDGKASAVGIAEFHFPVHVQERVALMRAKAKLQGLLNKEDDVVVRKKHRDTEGNLYLLVVSQ